MDTQSQEWFGIAEAAEYLKVSEQTIYRWMREGKLSFYKVGDSTRFRKENLDILFKKHTSEEEAKSYGSTCVACGNSELISGSMQSTGKVYFRPAQTKFFTLLEPNISMKGMVFPKCGFIQFFADTEKLSKVRKDPNAANHQQ